MIYCQSQAHLLSSYGDVRVGEALIKSRKSSAGLDEGLNVMAVLCPLTVDKENVDCMPFETRSRLATIPTEEKTFIS